MKLRTNSRRFTLTTRQRRVRRVRADLRLGQVYARSFAHFSPVDTNQPFLIPFDGIRNMPQTIENKQQRYVLIPHELRYWPGQLIQLVSSCSAAALRESRAPESGITSHESPSPKAAHTL